MVLVGFRVRLVNSQSPNPTHSRCFFRVPLSKWYLHGALTRHTNNLGQWQEESTGTLVLLSAPTTGRTHKSLLQKGLRHVGLVAEWISFKFFGLSI